MKRDFDLIRSILLEVEGEEKIDLSKYTKDQISYHKALLIEAGFAIGPQPRYSSRKESEIPTFVHITKLTWEGHEFLDKAKSDTAWEKAKKFIVDKGLSLSIDALKMALNKTIESIVT